MFATPCGCTPGRCRRFVAPRRPARTRSPMPTASEPRKWPRHCSGGCWSTCRHCPSGLWHRRRPRFAFRFKRLIHVVDSTTIQLVANCLDWAKHRRRKAAAKCHLRLNLQSFLPRFAIVDTAGEHDNLRARELCAGVQAGEIVIFDKAYVDLPIWPICRCGKSSGSPAPRTTCNAGWCAGFSPAAAATFCGTT